MRHISVIIYFVLLVACNNTHTTEVKNGFITDNSEIENSYLQNDCNHLPKTFGSYYEAIRIIKATNFNFKDDVNTTGSSWIRSASYYSCDNQFGYFILYTDQKEYIYKDFPKNIWLGFKSANSFGNYYNLNIKNRYTLFLFDK